MIVNLCIFWFSEKKLNFIGQLFNDNGNIKPWKDVKLEFHFKDIHKIYWLNIIDALPKTWNDIILKYKGNTNNLVFLATVLKKNLRSCNLKLNDKAIMHLSWDCIIIKRIWNQLKFVLPTNLTFPISTPQSAIFGFCDLDTNEHLMLNHLLLIFSMYIFNARTTGYLNTSHLLIYTKSIKDTTKKLCDNWCKKEK